MKRRRCLSILAGVGAGAGAAVLNGCERKRAQVTRWRGVLFNADVDLVIHDLPTEQAQGLIKRCVSEMQRLEGVFTLYDSDSVLCTLNREGRVANPGPEFVALVEEALAVAERAGGVFDPTVQPYWVWLREEVESGRVPDEAAQRERLALVDYREVHCSSGEVRFGRPGMAMTLNGIAQGWITDRVCKLMREGGAAHCLVNLGEFHALGGQSDGKDWRVAMRGAEEIEIPLRERALAVSSGAGLYFGTGTGRNHLIDPRSGNCAEDRRVVAVTAPRASLADALSTACAVIGDGAARTLAEKWEGVELRIVRPG